MTEISKTDVSRRDIIKVGSALGTGLTTLTTNGCTSKDRKVGVDINPSSRRLVSQFGLKYPIFQAAPGGEKLAMAVANAGGMGAVTLGWSSPEMAAQTVTRMLAGTNGNFYGNFVLHFGAFALQAALDAGCPCVQFSWGLPSQDMVNSIRDAGATLGIQVSTRDGAEKALRHRPDFLICQGVEAGGHVQATAPLGETLCDVVKLAGDVPVIAAGGLSNGHDIRRVMQLGVAGAVMGTRFMATQESDAHAEYKARLLDADGQSTAYTNCFNRDWGAAHRVLRNTTLDDWEAEGCPVKGNKSGENDIVATHTKMGPVLRYSVMPPVKGHEGAVSEMAMYAGTGVGKVNDLPSAKVLIERIWAEVNAA